MTLQDRIEQLVARHGSLRAAARVVQIEPGYLCRLRAGEKVNPQKDLLRRLGLRRVIDYVPISQAVQQQEESQGPEHAALWAAELERSFADVRDMVLNERGPLAEAGMTGEQINCVLAIIDAAAPSKPAGNAP